MRKEDENPDVDWRLPGGRPHPPSCVCRRCSTMFLPELFREQDRLNELRQMRLDTQKVYYYRPTHERNALMWLAGKLRALWDRLRGG